MKGFPMQLKGSLKKMQFMWVKWSLCERKEIKSKNIANTECHNND